MRYHFVVGQNAFSTHYGEDPRWRTRDFPVLPYVWDRARSMYFPGYRIEIEQLYPEQRFYK